MWAFPHCTKATRKTRKLDGLYLRIVVNCTKAVLAGDTAAVSRFRAEDLAFADERLFAAATRPAEDGFRAELIDALMASTRGFADIITPQANHGTHGRRS